MTLDQARAWATLVGITGQLLMTSDDMPKLGEDRVEILRRIFPVADIRPMELYPLLGKPRIFDLRVATPRAGQWDVVALFNWDTRSTASLRLDPKELGWPAGGYVYYDVWEKKLLGVGESRPDAGAADDLVQAGGRPAAGRPPATGRHFASHHPGRRRSAGGPLGLGGGNMGRSEPRRGRRSVPVAVYPPARLDLHGRESNDRGALGGPHLAERSEPDRLLAMQLPAASAAAAKPQINHAQVTAAGSAATISWEGEGAVAYRVYRNGELLAQTGDTSLTDRGRPRGTWRYEVAALDWQGDETVRVPAGVFERTADAADARPKMRGSTT